MSNPTIRLGLMPPLSGLVDIYGLEISRAARIACEEINQAGGLLGLPLEVVEEDDGSLPDTAVPAALRLLDEHGCVALIGNLLSNSRIAVVDQVVNLRCKPLLNFSFYEGSIRSPWFFHFAALPNQQIDRMIPFMARRFGPKMFFAGNNYEWPRGSIDAAKRALQGVDGDVVGEVYLPLGVPVTDLDALLDEVARSGADVFVPYFAGSDQMALLTRFTACGLKSRMAIVMGHFDEMMASRLPPHVRDGLYASNTYFMCLDTAENQRMLAQLARQPGVSALWPHGNGILTHLGEAVYLCVHAFANAVRAAGTTDAAALRLALKHVQVQGPQGLVQMDAQTQHASVNSFLVRCQADGMFTVIERFGLCPPQMPERYRAQPQDAKLHESEPSPEVAARFAAEMGAAQQRQGAARRILAVADMAILATDSRGQITEANRSACRLFGYKEEELVGLSVNLLMPPHFRERHAMLLQRFVEGEDNELRMSGRQEITGYRKDGSFFPLEASIAKFDTGDKLLLVVTMRDISVHKKNEDEQIRRATHDPLTGLPNRALIRERLANALQRSRRSGLSVALLFIDLDGFKLINDTRGHDAGDEVLKIVASRLLEQVRPGDTVARLTGDEFVVLCEQLEQPATLSGLAERLNQSLRQPCDLGTEPLVVTASIGVAIGGGSTHSAQDLLRQADTAMYAVKGRGRDSWQFFSESLHEQAQQRLAITTGLRMAIERQELSTRFQPILSTDSGQIMGAELLLRWKPDSGDVSPAVFIPIAEMTGAIVPIGLWVFREACRTEADWRRRWGAQAPYVAVNLSARQLSEENLAEQFLDILQASGADPQRLLLEITETALMADVETNLRVLRRLADLGLRVAVDDFGTGYSSLAQLSRMPVDVLKIDRAFVDGIDKSAESRTIIRAIISLGRALGLKLVAEGVENVAQHQELCANGCDLVQGYHFHQPMRVDALVSLLDNRPHPSLPNTVSALYFLIYASRATHPFTLPELESLKQQIGRINRTLGLSGCLIHDDGCFMQMLEGSREAVQVAMAKIQADPRHTDIHIVAQGAQKRRAFQEWGMNMGAQDMEALPPQPPAVGQAHRRITLMDIAQDPRTAYLLMTAQLRS